MFIENGIHQGFLSKILTLPQVRLEMNVRRKIFCETTLRDCPFFIIPFLRPAACPRDPVLLQTSRSREQAVGRSKQVNTLEILGYG